MRRVSLRFPSWARLIFSGVFLISLITGLLWFSLDRWGEVEGDFGPQKHPWISTLTKIHGAAAFLGLIAIGMILGAHVPVGWRTNRRRRSGLAFCVCLAMLISSAWGLYYAGSDEWRETLVIVHLSAGLSVPVLLCCHLLKRKQKRVGERCLTNLGI